MLALRRTQSFSPWCADKRSQSVLVSAHPIQQLILEITERDALLVLIIGLPASCIVKTSNWRLMLRHRQQFVFLA